MSEERCVQRTVTLLILPSTCLEYLSSSSYFKLHDTYAAYAISYSVFTFFKHTVNVSHKRLRMPQASVTRMSQCQFANISNWGWAQIVQKFERIPGCVEKLTLHKIPSESHSVKHIHKEPDIYRHLFEAP